MFSCLSEFFVFSRRRSSWRTFAWAAQRGNAGETPTGRWNPWKHFGRACRIAPLNCPERRYSSCAFTRARRRASGVFHPTAYFAGNEGQDCSTNRFALSRLCARTANFCAPLQMIPAGPATWRHVQPIRRRRNRSHRRGVQSFAVPPLKRATTLCRVPRPATHFVCSPGR